MSEYSLRAAYLNWQSHCLATTTPHGKGEVQGQNVHKLGEMPFLLLSAQDLHTLLPHLKMQSQWILEISGKNKAEMNGKQS